MAVDDAIGIQNTPASIGTYAVTTGEGAVQRETLVPADAENAESYGTPGKNRFSDSAVLDAFGRLRECSLEAILESDFRYGLDAFKWTSSPNGAASATFSAADNGLILSTGGTANSDYLYFSSVRRSKISPSLGSLVLISFVIGTQPADCLTKVGFGTDTTGIFFSVDGASVSFIMHSSVTGSAVDTNYDQSVWNIDSLDGTGPSGITLDLTKAQTFFIDLVNNGDGRVRLGFIINGRPVVAHEIAGANASDQLLLGSGFVGLRVYVGNSSAPSAASHSILLLGAALMSETASSAAPRRLFSAQRTSTYSALSGSTKPIISVRSKSNGPNSVANAGLILPKAVTLYSTSNDAWFQLAIAASLTGASWSAINASYSLADYDVSATEVTAGYIPIESGYIRAGVARRILVDPEGRYRDMAIRVASYSGARNIFSVLARGLGATCTLYAAIEWDEEGV